MKTYHLVINQHLHPLVFDSVKHKNYFPLPNGSNSFGTVDYNAHNNTKIEFSIGQVITYLST